MKIIKKDICNKVIEKSKGQLYTQEIRKYDIQRIVDLFLEVLIDELMKGNSIELRGFGSFERKINRTKYYAMNPRTRKEVETKDYYKVTFHPGKKFKNMMKQLPIEEKDKEKPYKPIITSLHWNPKLESYDEYRKRFEEMTKNGRL